MRILPLGLAALVALGCSDDKEPAATRDARLAQSEPTKPARPAPIDGAPAAEPTAPETGTTASCAMVTRAEAAAALGMPVGAGSPANAGCSWESAAAGDEAVVFELHPAAQFEVARKVASDMAEKGGPRGSYEDLSGVGEAAFYSGLAGHKIVFRVGARYGKLGLLGLKDAASKKRGIELASQLAARMKPEQ